MLAKSGNAGAGVEAGVAIAEVAAATSFPPTGMPIRRIASSLFASSPPVTISRPADRAPTAAGL